MKRLVAQKDACFESLGRPVQVWSDDHLKQKGLTLVAWDMKLAQVPVQTLSQKCFDEQASRRRSEEKLKSMKEAMENDVCPLRHSVGPAGSFQAFLV